MSEVSGAATVVVAGVGVGAWAVGHGRPAVTRRPARRNYGMFTRDWMAWEVVATTLVLAW